MHTAQPNSAGPTCRNDGSRKRTVWLCLLLALVTGAVYAPVATLEFVDYDDPDYVVNNPHVQAGFTVAGVNWAFGKVHGLATYWHPLTWVSHMLDCQLFGLSPAGHHLVNLLFHILNTVLVFLVFKRLTGAFWRSALLAALFGLHPLQVDTVAWVAERKNLLSTLFWLLTMWAYVRFAEAQSTKSEFERQDPTSSATHPVSRFTFHVSFYYLLSLCFFSLGLMCKPVLVTLPFVLLLLDYWPLGRLKPKTQDSRLKTSLPLVLEKLPFFALSAASCLITLMAHQGLGLLPSSGLPLDLRLESALVSYVRYLGKAIWPVNLAVFYPFSASLPTELVVLSGLLLLGVSALAVGAARSRPWLFVGWFWFLGVLVPFIGVVQAGLQAMADRFMYVPLIGLFLGVVWGVADLTAGWARRVVPLTVGAVAVLAALAGATGKQLLYWQNTESLFRHALAVTKDNYMAYDVLGFWFAQHGQVELAKKYYQHAIRIAPDYLGAQNHLGWALVRQKRYEEARAVFASMLSQNPQSAEAESNLGATLYWLGKTDQAIEHLRAAVRLNPEHPLTRYNLGNALLQQDKIAEAAEEFRLAAKLNPRYAEAHNNLALALAKQGKLDEAAVQFRRAVAVQPDLAPAHYGLGELLLAQGKLDEAIGESSEVLRLQPNHAPAWVQMGLARARQGKAAEAAEALSAALRIKPDDAQAQYHLASALASQGQTREAVRHYQALLKRLPDFAEALNNLAWILAANPDPQVRNGREAVALAERACKLTQNKEPLLVGTLAAAYAEAGRFAEAVATAEKAKTMAEKAGLMELAARNRTLLELYRSGQPARDTP